MTKCIIKGMHMKKNLSINNLAKEKLIEDIDLNGTILEVGPFYRPLFQKNETNVYYADIKSTEEVLKRYDYLSDEILEKVVPIDYVIKDSYENTFKDEDMEFDYVVLSHVLEHIPNPIEFLLDVSTILSEKGKICLLLPNKEFTFDSYRENSSFADLYDVYIHGPEKNIPRIFLDNRLGVVSENNSIKYWNETVDDFPQPNIEQVLKEYRNFINDFENQTFDGHHWVFTDESFLKIMENMLKLNLLPLKPYSFYPTAINSNTFGIILEYDKTIQTNFNERKRLINEIHEININIKKQRKEYEIKEIIKENKILKEQLNKIKNILK